MARCNEKVKTSVTIERRNMVIPCTSVTCIEAATKRPVASYILGCVIRDKVVSYYDTVEQIYQNSHKSRNLNSPR